MGLFKLSEDKYILMKDVSSVKREGTKVYLGHNFEVTYKTESEAKEALRKVVDAIGYVDILENAVQINT